MPYQWQRIFHGRKQQHSANQFGRDPFREYWEAKVLEEIKTHTYLDPLYDVAFKIFLGDESALISFLNGVFRLKAENKITEVSIKNSEINIGFPKPKEFKFDIRASTADNRYINIE
ncbi:PD-(D/E)XK nuclease family transposase [Fibrobacter sp.]|uniref:PD-(D/E)XK nuclease family transposase n=1 Tax=Fibrobacter sp. TaxID=35828 RepID=UPI0025B8392E|nr:PD-(D/E)XK nuclease family transposase [Fibrobacter sp.]